MKKTFAFVFFVIVVSGVCFAQNNEQRIIGTWIVNSDESGPETWIFNADGTLSIGRSIYKYGITDRALITFPTEAPLPGRITSGDRRVIGERIKGDTIIYYYFIYNYSISSDGKTLILEYTDYRREGTHGIWLKKK
jgi:hypothetical protein